MFKIISRTPVPNNRFQYEVEVVPFEKEPAFTCIPNCGRCCQIVSIPVEVFEKHTLDFQKPLKWLLYSSGEVDCPKCNTRIIAKQVWAVTEDGFCIFQKPDKQCAIYEDRPAICHLFGTVEKYRCPYHEKDGSSVEPKFQAARLKDIDEARERTIARFEKAIKGEKIEMKEGKL